MHFTSRAHLVNDLREELDDDEILDFAKQVSEHPLTKSSIRLKGSIEEILSLLVLAPKAVLEQVYDDFFDNDCGDENWFNEDGDTEDDEDCFEEEDD